MAGQEAFSLKTAEPGFRLLPKSRAWQAEADDLCDRAIHAPFAEPDFGERPIGDGAVPYAKDDARPGDAPVRAGQGSIDPADMTCLGIAVGDHGLDSGACLTKKPKGTGAKEAFAILRNAVEQDQPREDASFGGIGKAGMPGDDGVGRRHSKDGHTFQHRLAAEETYRDLSV